MKLGILKESQGENRVAMLPETAEALAKLKVEVLVEKDAGKTAYASDKQFEEAGAKIDSREKVINQSDIIVMIQPPSVEEVKKFKDGQVIIAVFNPFLNKNLVNATAAQNLTTFSLDLVPRSTRGQAMDILSSQATVSGYKSVLAAANTMDKFFPMFMSSAGTIKPAKMLILGAGVAGLQAIATARKLGAVVEVFDVRAAVKEEVMSLGGKFVEVEGSTDDAAAGGYAVEQTEEFKQKQQQAIHDHAAKSDVVICTAQIFGRQAPVLIKKETVEQMIPGSIIIDLAASTGGNCELTKNNETIEHNGVKIVGKSDYPSDMATDSSRMFGKNLFNFLKLIIDEEGALNLNFEDELVVGTCLTRDKEVVHEKVKEFVKN